MQRELPTGVYPDGPASAFFSTASIDSKAAAIASLYENLERIYENYFPQTTNERIDDWIDKAFIGVSFDDSVTLQEKRDRVVAKLRHKPTLALWEVLTLVAGYIPEGNYVQIVENCSATGAWMLGESELGVGTALGYDHNFNNLGLDCSQCCEQFADRGWRLGVDQLGVTTELDEVGYLPVIEAQLQAFGYEIRIFDTAVTGTSYNQLLRQLGETEPARSVHQIRQNLELSAFGLTNPVTDLDEFDLVDCITRDSASDTGYSGLVP